MPVDKLSIQQFAQKVKTKYPEYKDVDDSALVEKMVAKYPEYKDKIKYNQVVESAKPVQPAFQVQLSNPTFKSAPTNTGERTFTDVKPVDPYAPVKLQHKATEAHAKLQEELIGNRDVKEKMIKQRRFDEAARDVPLAKSDMPKTQSSIDVNRIIASSVKPQDLPVTDDDLAKEDLDIQADRGKAVRLLEETMKTRPERAKDIQKNVYTIDAYNSLAQTPDIAQERVHKIEENAKQLAKGNLIYDARSNTLIKPLGIIGGAVEGWKQKSKLFADYDFLKHTENDAAIASELEDRRINIDPDEPIPVPKGKLAEVVGMLAGTPVKPIIGGFIASALTTPAGGATAGAAIGGREFAKMEYASNFQQVYNELRSQGVEKFEAVRTARQQAEQAAEIGAITGAAMGAVGGRIGMRPMALSSTFKNAAFNVLKSTGNELGKAGLEGLAAGGVGAAGQLYKNKLAQQAGIKRDIDEGVMEQIEGNLLSTVAMAAAIKAGRGVTKPNYKSLLHGLSKMPDEQISGMLKEKVDAGEITQQAADQTLERINEYKGLDKLIPDNVTEDARFKIQDKITKRTELEQKLESTDKAYHPEIKEKIKSIDEEIIGLSKEKEKSQKPESGLSKQQEKEATEFAEELVVEGILPDTYEAMIKSDPVGFWKMVAQQAQNRDENWKPLTEALPDEAVRDQFGETVVDYAKELFPAPDAPVSTGNISVIMPGEIKHPETITISPREQPAEVTSTDKVSVIMPKSSVGESVSNANVQPESASVAQETVPSLGEPREIGITHRQMDVLAEELGLPTYEKSPEKVTEWDQQASQKLQQPEALNNLFNKLRKGELPDHVETRMMLQYMGDIAAKIEKDPYNTALQDQMLRTKDLFNIAGRLQAKGLAARKGSILVEEILPDFLIRDREVNKAPLTDDQITVSKKEFEAMKAAKDALEAKMVIDKERAVKVKAEKIVADEAKAAKKNAKKDYTNEREKIFTDIKEKLRKARGDTNVVIVPYAKELIAIAPDVIKLVRNYVEQGVVELPELVKHVRAALKDDIPHITENDVHNIIAGEYNQKKPTRSQLAQQVYDLRKEASLINQLEDLQNGQVPASKNKQRQRNQKIEKLRNEIKELRDEMGLNEKTEAEKLSALKARYKSQISDLEKKIAAGEYGPDVKPEPIKLDKEATDLKDQMIKVKLDREARLAKQEYENRTDIQKAKDTAADALDAVRTLQTNPDLSFFGRQGIRYLVTHPIKGPKLFWESVRQAGSQKRYDRWLFDMHNSPTWKLIEDSGLAVLDPNTLHASQREEQWRSQLIHKIPVAGQIARGSERAFTSAANMARVDWFMEGVKVLRDQNKTWENSPEEYKGWASAVNNMTGRGGLGKLEPVVGQLAIPFWSPRLIAANVNLFLNPAYYIKMPKTARTMLIKNMAQYVATGGAFLGLANVLGADTEVDPRSSDFGKIKVGNTRYDIWGGASQYIRVLSQLLTASRKSNGSVSELKPRQMVTTGTNLVRTKLSPIWGFMIDAKLGENVVGEKVEWADAYKLMIPMLWNDIQESKKDSGPDGAAVDGLLSFLGIGAQTYGGESKSGSSGGKQGKEGKTK